MRASRDPSMVLEIAFVSVVVSVSRPVRSIVIAGFVIDPLCPCSDRFCICLHVINQTRINALLFGSGFVLGCFSLVSGLGCYIPVSVLGCFSLICPCSLTMQTFLVAWPEKIWPTIRATYEELLAQRPLSHGDGATGVLYGENIQVLCA
jgi:hypothetical protein